ncbi:MAG: NAD(P)-dependent oxidoreductase [Cyclobacteriaceae bacterium]|nr:NAD(P)-dependent oxidoreductase [Cyclobacteriaceae bacterium]
MIKIGLIREGKVPADKRVPATPAQAHLIQTQFPTCKVFVQSSATRCFSDQDYRDAGIEVVESVEACDILFGVKEVPITSLIGGKTYFFFSHTIKKQPYNRNLLREILNKRIRLIDYETLTDKNGQRIIAFGKWAGIVGAYNGLWLYGRKNRLFELRRAKDCLDLADLKTEFSKIKLPPIKMAITGGGRVAEGAKEVLREVGVKEVSPGELLNGIFAYPVFAQLHSSDYYHRKDGSEYSRQDFFEFPEKYGSNFMPYANKTDLLIAAAYWNPSAPVLFKREDIVTDEFQISVIADVSCDIEGSIPSTKKASTIDDPVYDYDATEDRVLPPFSGGDISVMAIDNLPCELPRDASNSFGEQLIKNVLPHLLGGDQNGVIHRAMITDEGRLTPKFGYLQAYVDGE